MLLLLKRAALYVYETSVLLSMLLFLKRAPLNVYETKYYVDFICM